MLVERGRLWAKVGDEESEVGPGSLLIIPSNHVHAFRQLTDEDVIVSAQGGVDAAGDKALEMEGHLALLWLESAGYCIGRIPDSFQRAIRVMWYCR